MTSGIRRINVAGHKEMVVDAFAAESEDRRHGKGRLVPRLSDWVPHESQVSHIFGVRWNNPIRQNRFRSSNAVRCQ